MKIGTDTYIYWKWKHYDQDVIKSCSSYICHTPARKIHSLTALLFLQSPPYPSANFSSPFLEISDMVNQPPTFKKGGIPNIVKMKFHDKPLEEKILLSLMN